MITVFTPTYNRKKEIANLYNSLLKQDDKRFKWLIIDDGSTDGTEEYVKKIKKSNNILINYVKKENGGKMSAVNLAYKLCDTEAIITIDSDDELVPDAISKMMVDFKSVKNDSDIAGIVYLCIYKNSNKIVGTDFPSDNMRCSFREIYDKYKVKGDKAIVWKTDVVKKYPYPMIEGEKFIPDAFIMNRISKDFSMLALNKVITKVEYLEGGYSNNYFALVKRNPKGNVLYFKELYEFQPSLYNVYVYILFSIYAKYNFKYIIENHRSKFKVLLLYIPTLIISKMR